MQQCVVYIALTFFATYTSLRSLGLSQVVVVEIHLLGLGQ